MSLSSRKHELRMTQQELQLPHKCVHITTFLKSPLTPSFLGDRGWKVRVEKRNGKMLAVVFTEGLGQGSRNKKKLGIRASGYSGKSTDSAQWAQGETWGQALVPTPSPTPRLSQHSPTDLTWYSGSVLTSSVTLDVLFNLCTPLFPYL